MFEMNAILGYQRRYFYLDPSTKILQYYISKDQLSQAPRGSLSLKCATVVNLPDDPMGFEVTSSNGDLFKLRANSTVDRHNWVSAIQCVIDLSSPDNNANMLSNSIRGPSVTRKANSRGSLSSSSLFNGQCNNQVDKRYTT